MSEWQPIETAPKDGTRVLVFSPDAREPQIFVAWLGSFILPGTKGEEDEGWIDAWSDDLVDAWPTHWQPLPAPPEQPHA